MSDAPYALISRAHKLRGDGFLSEAEFLQIKKEILHQGEHTEVQATQSQARTYPEVKIRDWKRTFSIFMSYFGIIFVSGTFAIGTTSLLVIPAIAAVLLPFALVTQIKGVHLSRNGVLRSPRPFPPFIGRVTTHLHAVSDANAEFFTRKNFGAVALTMLDKKSRRSDIKNERFYCVNLSGQFGTRTIKFQEKRKRDQLLSVLRDTAPHIRVSRWS